MKNKSSFRNMQLINLSSLRISEVIENSRPSTQKRRLFSRSALGMTGMQDSTGMTIPHGETSYATPQLPILHGPFLLPPSSVVPKSAPFGPNTGPEVANSP